MKFSSHDTVRQMATIFRALGHLLSVPILKVMLFESEGGLTTFNSLCRFLDGNQSDAIRESVSCLEEAGIVRRVENFEPEAFFVVDPNLITAILHSVRFVVVQQNRQALRSGYIPQRDLSVSVFP